MYKELDIVAITVDLPDKGLVSGSIGTIVQVYDSAYDVEFLGSSGRTVALVALTADKLRLS